MANIADSLERQCRERPEQVVIHAPTGRRAETGERIYRTITFAELGQRIRRLTAALGELGIVRGDRCALMVPPSIEFVELTFALFSMGAVPVFIDPGIGLKNLKACLAEAEPKAFLGVTKAHVARLLFGWARSTLKTFVTVGPRLGWGGITLEALRMASRTSADAVSMGTNETAAILFTSGSTGVPKGAVYTHGMFIAQLEKLREAFQIVPGEIDLCTFPLFALFGPALGMTSVIPVMDATRPAKVAPKEILEPVRRFGATNMFGSPALLNRVGRAAVAQSSRPQVPYSTLKRVLSAGAPVSPAIMSRFQQLLPDGVQIFTPYGATEALPVAVIGSRTVLEETRHLTATGSGTCVGHPVAGLNVRIVQIVDGPISAWSDELVLPAGQIGEIAVHGPQVTQEYFRRADLTALAKIPDSQRGGSWHRMGDVGYFDAQGRLWFCGRKSQRVTTADATHFTDPIEGVFNAQRGVFRSALVGVQREGVMQPLVCIERDRSQFSGSDRQLEQELQDLARRHVATQAVQTFLFHPRFPVDIRHNSKIFREQLAVWAQQMIARRA